LRQILCKRPLGRFRVRLVSLFTLRYIGNPVYYRDRGMRKGKHRTRGIWSKEIYYIKSSSRETRQRQNHQHPTILSRTSWSMKISLFLPQIQQLIRMMSLIVSVCNFVFPSHLWAPLLNQIGFGILGPQARKF
jgi:hypothetical protein